MAIPAVDKALLYARTVARMKPSMAAARLRKTKAVPEVSGKVSLHVPAIAIGSLDKDAAFARRFDLDALARDEFLLISERHMVDLTTWNVAVASHLWNFNLHYFEYCVPLAARYAVGGAREDVDQFKRLVLTWMAACEYPKGDAWHPYTISLRLINWLVCLDLFDDALAEDDVFMETLGRSMYRQYRHLLENQERHLLANHYFENLKTLVVCALVFGEDDVLARVERDFLTQLDEQILPDGVHYERSMMYHKLILEGLLRVELAYRSVGKQAPAKVAEKVGQMLDAMASIEKGMGKTPFFNDSADGVAKECGCLVEACRALYGYEANDSRGAFPISGFYKLYDGDAALVFFAGEPGPSCMLGHAHCDLLSFELSVDGKPAIVNSGTYAYQSELRSYFRSTAAHNTATINDEEQMECWAEHRVARGVRDVRVEESDGYKVVASFRNYRGRLHRRRIALGGGKLTVEDAAEGNTVALVQRFHIAAPELVTIVPSGDCALSKTETELSDTLGLIRTVPSVEVSCDGAGSCDIYYGPRDG